MVLKDILREFVLLISFKSLSFIIKNKTSSNFLTKKEKYNIILILFCINTN